MSCCHGISLYVFWRNHLSLGPGKTVLITNFTSIWYLSKNHSIQKHSHSFLWDISQNIVVTKWLHAETPSICFRNTRDVHT